MSCTITALNDDASFLLSFSPSPLAQSSPISPKPFTVVLDPWLTGPSNIGHRIFSTTSHITQPYTSTLASLPQPDLIIISQEKSDHCNEETLKTLPPTGGKFQILAEPAAAKRIRSWKYFSESQVVTLPKWEDGHVEFSIPGPFPSRQAGKLSVAFISPKWTLATPTGLHKSIAIIYQPPSPGLTSIDIHTPPHTPPSPNFPILSSQSSPHDPYNHHDTSKPVSILFAPHGCDSASVMKYASAHLRPKNALPLTALLHCFDEITNPTILGGNICKGLPGGLQLTRSLRPEVWISTHDGDKEVRGVGTQALKITKYERDAVEEAISPRDTASFGADVMEGKPPEVLALGVGEVYKIPRDTQLTSEIGSSYTSSLESQQELTPSQSLFDEAEIALRSPDVESRTCVKDKRRGIVFGDDFIAPDEWKVNLVDGGGYE